MTKTVALAFALVLGAAGTSFADLAYASSAATISGGTATSPAVNNAANIIGVADGATADFTDGGANGSHQSTITVHTGFAPGPETKLFVYFGSSPTDNATQHKFKTLVYTDSNGFTATLNADQDLGLSSPDQFQAGGGTLTYDKRFFNGSDNGDLFTLSNTGFNFNNIVSLDLTIQYTTTGGFTTNQQVFAIDAISNPEPGAIALFALGTAGLGGFAWKRRKTRLSSATRSA